MRFVGLFLTSVGGAPAGMADNLAPSVALAGSLRDARLPRDTARAMSQENVELIREAVEAISEQDLPRLIALTDPEVEWHSLLAQVGEGGVYRGHSGIKRYVRDLNEAWEFLRSSIDDTLMLGDLVVAVGRLRYRGKGSGVEMESAAGYVTQFRARKIVYMRAFREPEEALLSLGLSE